MKKSIAKKWVAALESGEYRKTKGRLCKEGKSSDSFCCLGVLTELYIQDHNKKSKEKIGWEYDYGPLSFMGEEETLHRDVREWAGMTDHFGSFDKNMVPEKVKIPEIWESSLVSVNDETDNFKAVTAIIKAAWKSL